MAPGKLNPASQFVIPPTVQENNDTPPAAPPMVGLPAVFVPTTVKPSFTFVLPQLLPPPPMAQSQTA
jgi:hypothetical protein